MAAPEIRKPTRQMSKLLFRLRHVPDDEIEEVRQLLEENQIDYFETSAGNWGISMPALWVQNDADFEQARALLDDYQQQRTVRVREEYRQLKELGEARTMWQVFQESPLKFIVYIGLIGLVLYVSLRFFLGFLL